MKPGFEVEICVYHALKNIFKSGAAATTGLSKWQVSVAENFLVMMQVVHGIPPDNNNLPCDLVSKMSTTSSEKLSSDVIKPSQQACFLCTPLLFLKH